MICQACGMDNEKSAVNCEHCGKPLVAPPCVRASNDACATMGMQGKGFGVGALILACLSFIFGGLVVPAATLTVLALVFCGLANQKSSQLGLVNKDAKSGMVFGIIAVAALAVNFVLAMTLLIVLLVLYFVLLLILCVVPIVLIAVAALI